MLVPNINFAAEDIDFETLTLQFTEEIYQHCFDLLAVDDDVYEFNERFLLTSSTSDTAVLLDPEEATVLIKDNDEGMYVYTCRC